MKHHHAPLPALPQEEGGEDGQFQSLAEAEVSISITLPARLDSLGELRQEQSFHVAIPKTKRPPKLAKSIHNTFMHIEGNSNEESFGSKSFVPGIIIALFTIPLC
ncbi:hypothetical protein TREES_T100008767 [Tupaia chinensis]|uniref:Uncharacterized protein n=1 Tax=Tupaia chinensis TaxID=246437 RepID=L9L1E9_TUPCH|nr:hypothetical protein TREES_T100008767 [Tupaia chinensis]